jgi:hypothetical protein
MLLLLCSKESSIKKAFMSKIFTSMNRVNFSFLVFYDYIVIIFYAFYNIQIHLDYSNALFMTLTLLTIILTFSYISVIFIDLPFRLVYRNMLEKLNKLKDESDNKII